MRKYLYHFISNIIKNTNWALLPYSNEALQNILNNYQNLSEEEVNRYITQFLKERSEGIKEKKKTIPEWEDTLNKICLELARQVDSQKPHILLWPDLVGKADCYGNQFQDINYDDFIVSEQETYFIHFDFFSSLWERLKNGEKNILKYLNKDFIETSLTQKEKNEIINRIPFTKEFFEILDSNKNYDTKSIFDRLQILSNALMYGDKDHGGSEHNAGVSANVAIVSFHEYFFSLPYDNQMMLINLKSPSCSNSFGDILNQLFKPIAKARYSSPCVQIASGECHHIYSHNAEKLRAMDADPTFEKLKQLYQRIDQHIKLPILNTLIKDDLYLFTRLCHLDELKTSRNLIIDKDNNKTYLHFCAEYSSRRIASFLLKYFNAETFINVQDSSGRTALYFAAQMGDFKMVKWLIKNGAEVDLSGQLGSPLYIACEKNHVKIVNYLLIHGANPNHFCHEKNHYPLMIASEKGHIEIVKHLVNNGANINETTYDSPLYLASQFGHSKVVEYLIQHEAEVNHVRDDGSTSLYAACFYNRLDVLKILIRNGAKIDIVKNNGTTPLYISSYRGYEDIVKCLIENDVNVNIDANQPNVQTPLQIAAFNGFTKIVEMLMDAGGDLNDNDGNRSILSRAIFNRNLDTAKVILFKYLSFYSLKEMKFSFFFLGLPTFEIDKVYAKELTDVFIKFYSDSKTSVLEQNLTCFEVLINNLPWLIRQCHLFTKTFEQLKNNILEELTKELKKVFFISPKQHERIKSVLHYERNLIPGLFAPTSILKYNDLITKRNIIIKSEPTISKVLQI